MEMIALAHEATPYGHVLINGSAPDIATLSRLVGAGESECEALMAELDRNGVFSRTRNGVIYSRRMVRDQKKAVHAQKIGKTGGNPTLGKQRENPPQVNPPDKGGDKPQKPEARSQIPEGKKEDPVGSSKNRPSKGSRLDPGWTLPSEWADWCGDNLGWPPDRTARTAERFRDFWLGKPGQGGVKADWLATWRNWCRKDNDERPQPVKVSGDFEQWRQRIAGYYEHRVWLPGWGDKPDSEGGDKPYLRVPGVRELIQRRAA